MIFRLYIFRHQFDEMALLQQEYVRRVEDKICSLEIVNDGKAVRVLGGGKEAVIPTTEELTAYIHEQETQDEIESFQENVMQLAEEKVVIAEQTLSLVDNICKRLDSDVKEMEKVLLVRMLLWVTGDNMFWSTSLIFCFPFRFVSYHRSILENSKRQEQRNQTIWLLSTWFQEQLIGFLPRLFRMTLEQGCSIYLTKTQKVIKVSPKFFSSEALDTALKLIDVYIFPWYHDSF